MKTQSIYSEHIPAGTHRRKSTFGSVAGSIQYKLRRILSPMMAARLEREAVRELSRLSPRILRDIGLNRGDIHSIASDLAKERADAWARPARDSNSFHSRRSVPRVTGGLKGKARD